MAKSQTFRGMGLNVCSYPESGHSGVGLTFRVWVLSFGYVFSFPSNQASIFPFVCFAVAGFAADGYLG